MLAVGRTWIPVVLPIVSESMAFVPETVSVTVMFVASVMAADALVMFCPR